MEEKKVIRMDEHKNKNKVHKLSGKKILLGIVAVLILTVVIIAGTCKTKQIKISGLSYYTEAEVKKAVVENGYIDNSVAYFLKCKIASPDLLPFIDSIHVRINRPDTITVEVKEKKRLDAFCIMENTSILIKMVMHWKVMKRNMTMFHWLLDLNIMNWSCRRRFQSRKRKFFLIF